MPKLNLWTGLVLGVGLVLLVVLLGRQATGLTFTREDPEERERRLAAHWRLVLPDGAGPHPAAILLSGCDGVRDNMEFWAGEFLDQGRATLILDSHMPRGLDRFEAWRLVCSGLALTGGERSGDIAVALHALTGMKEITDDVVIFGASHGGWAAMEFVAQTVSGDVPPGLARWPAPPDDLRRSASALVLLYPYCGILNGADAEHWPQSPPVQIILAEDDSIVSTPSCLQRAESLQQAGGTVETLVIPGVDHGFDQEEKSSLSTLDFVPTARDAAAQEVRSFLRRNGL